MKIVFKVYIVYFGGMNKSGDGAPDLTQRFMTSSDLCLEMYRYTLANIAVTNRLVSLNLAFILAETFFLDNTVGMLITMLNSVTKQKT